MNPAAEKVLILDRGNLELALPGDWTVKPDPAGFMKLEDAGEDCLLEVSYMKLPPLSRNAPTVEQRLRAVLPVPAPATSVDRGDLRLAWADYPYESDDTERGERRAARGRWLIAENGRVQALTTFYYWADDAARFLPVWERIMATLRLGFGEQLASPRQHWTFRDPE